MQRVREPFAWDTIMAVGLGLLRIRPQDFWAMTPAELDAVLKGAFGEGIGGPGPSRADLIGLMGRFPDRT